jgi:hypothetical protein
MKRITKLILVLSCLLYSAGLFGQSYVGAFAGLNSSKLSGDAPNSANYKSLMGANVGAFVDIKLGKSLWLSLQPSYSQEGTKIEYTVKGKEEPVDSITVGLDYFSLPLLFKVSSPKGKFYAIGGVEGAYLLSSSKTSHDVKEDLEVTVKDFNIAMHFGAGIHVPVGFPRLFFEVRYTQGLVNLTDDPIDNNILPRVKTSGFKLFAGIEIPLKRTSN